MLDNGGEPHAVGAAPEFVVEPFGSEREDGRRLERAIYLARMLRQITLPLSEQESPLLECLLEVADSSMTYRTRYYTTLQPIAVLDVLMADGGNPRSLDFQLAHLVDQYQKLPRHMADDLEAMRDALAVLRGFNLRELNYGLPSRSSKAKSSRPASICGLATSPTACAPVFSPGLIPPWANGSTN